MTDTTNETPLADSYEQWLELNPLEPIPAPEPDVPEETDEMCKAARAFGFNPDVPGFWTYSDEVGTCTILGGVGVAFNFDEDGEAQAWVGLNPSYTREVLREDIQAAIDRRARYAVERAENERKAARSKVVRVVDDFDRVTALVNDGYLIQHAFGVNHEGMAYEVYILALPDALPPRE